MSERIKAALDVVLFVALLSALVCGTTVCFVARGMDVATLRFKAAQLPRSAVLEREAQNVAQAQSVAAGPWMESRNTDAPMVSVRFEWNTVGTRTVAILTDANDSGRLIWSEDGTLYFEGKVNESAKAFAHVVAGYIRTAWPRQEAKP